MNNHHFSLKLACLFTFGALTLVQGCNDDGDANDKPDTTIPIDTGGKSSSGGKSGVAGKSDDGGGTAGSSNSADAGATSEGGTGATGSGEGGTASEGGTSAVEPPKCALPELGSNGCFNCPTDNLTAEWLNRCVSGLDYDNVFDNAERVPLLPADGKLPPFPN